MDKVDIDFIISYPLISAETISETSTKYKGLVQVNYVDFRIEIVEKQLENDGQLNEYEIVAAKDLPDQFAKKQHCKNIMEMLDKLVNSLQHSMKRVTMENNTFAYKKILHEYNEFSKFFMNLKAPKLYDDLSKISVSVDDERGRDHTVIISTGSFKGDQLFHIETCSLPQPKNSPLLGKPFSSLILLFNSFLAMLESLQPFFDFMDALDQSSCILDPEKPERSDNYRRIWLEKNLSAVVTVDPFDMQSRPTIAVLGPEQLVGEYRDKLNQNLELWNSSRDPSENVANVLRLLGIESFPKRTRTDSGAGQSSTLEESEGCSICFSSHFNGKFPDVICQNTHCRNCYHTECLYEWLISISNKKVFNEIFGQCPNCEQNISCNIPAGEY